VNGTLAENIRRQLMPALEQSQGFQGTYSRAGSNRSLIVVPVKPEWMTQENQGVGIEMWKGLEFVVSGEQWAATGFGVPALNDRLTVTLADGVQQVYALLPPKNMRPYEQDATSGTYFLRMKLVAG
jgi:hypothetical protein